MFTFVVRPDGGEQFEIKASTRDVLVWEKAKSNRSMAALVNDMHIADVYAVAHIAARRLQLFTGPLDEFEATCDLDIEKVLAGPVEDEETDPTQSGP